MARRIDLPFSKSVARWRGEMTSVNGENLQKMTKSFQDFLLLISLLTSVSANKNFFDFLFILF
jgi:hypothetical protein